MRRTTLLSFINDCAARGNDIALAGRKGVRVVRWSYTRLAAESFRTARELEARGVGRGDRVIIWAENSPAWVATFFAVLLRGAIVVPLDAQSATDFASRVQAQVGAKLLLAGDVDADAISSDVPRLRLSSLSETVARHSGETYQANDVGADAIAEIIFTSGTTAEPKGVVLTHGNLLANVEPIEREAQKYLKWERLVHPIRFLNLVPLSHVFGQFMGILMPQLVGGAVFFQESLKPAEIIETTRRERISVVVAVPRLLDTLREKIERDYETRGMLNEFRRKIERANEWNAARRWWEFRDVHRRFGFKFWAFVVGGATLEETTETFWRRLGFAVVQGYGMTETASLIAVNHPFKQGRGSIGESLPGQEIKLGASGEIMVRGANVSPGYWSNGGLQTAGDADGWLATGDVAEIDERGKLYFRGRTKDVIVTAAGLNIYPDDLEAALNRQTEVRASAVVGYAGARGEEPIAVIVLRDANADVATIIERANERLARHQQIRRWLVWEETDLPRTPTHKVIRREVERVVAGRFNEERDADESSVETSDASTLTRPRAASASTLDALAEIIVRVGGHVGTTGLSPAMNLTTDLKLDSLGRVELLGALEDRYQVELDEAAFTAATTLDDVERLLRQSAASITSTATITSAASIASNASDATRADARLVDAERTVATDQGGRAGGNISAPIETEGAEIESDNPTRVARYPYPRWSLRFPATWARLALLYTVAFPFVRLLCPRRVVGRERLDRLGSGPALFVANHITYVDHALILSTLPARRAHRLAIAMEGEILRDWRHAPQASNAASSAFMRLLGRIEYFIVVLFFNVFPLPKRSGFRRSFAHAGACVDRGFNVLVFPEGKRAEGMSMNPFQRGVGLLVSELNVPVVPVKIEGLYELKRSGRRIALPGEVTVKFGGPITFDEDAEPSHVAATLERCVSEL
jgi:long-chain acyl-CoA synthetase